MGFAEIEASSPSSHSQQSFDLFVDVMSSEPQVQGHQFVSVEPLFEPLGHVPLPQRER